MKHPDLHLARQVGERIKLYRERRNRTQAAVAEMAGLPLRLYRLIERGEEMDPGLTAVAAIASALCIRLDRLVPTGQPRRIETPDGRLYLIGTGSWECDV